MKPAFQVIGEIIRTSVVRNFEVGGRYSAPGSWRGGPKSWQPLSIAALFAGKKSKFAAKSGKFKKGVEEKFKNRAILVKQGHLMNSISCRADGDGVAVGTNLIYKSKEY